MLPRSLLLALLLGTPIMTHADSLGIADSKMIMQLAELYNTMLAQLEVVKKQYDIGRELYDLSRADATSIDRLLDTRLVGMMKQKGWLVDGLDPLQDVVTLNRQIRHLVELMAQIKDEAEQRRLQAIIDLLKQDRTMLQLAGQTERNLGKSATDVSTRESSRITAENTAILARTAIAAQQERNRQLAARKSAQSDEQRITAGVAQIYQQVEKR